MAIDIKSLIEQAEIFGENADVTTPSSEYVQMEEWRLLSRALMVGTGEHGSGDEGLLDNADTLLPQMPGEFDADYEFRRDHLSYMPPLFPNAVSDLVSALLSSPIYLDGKQIPKAIIEPDGVWSNIDITGKSGDAFLAESATSAVAEGLDYIFVDYPSIPRDFDELQRRQLKPRVYWSRIPARCVIEVTPQLVGSRSVIARAKVADLDFDEAGEWGRKPFVRIKVFRRGNPFLERGDTGRYAFAEIWEGEPGKKLTMTDVKPILPPEGLEDAQDAEFAEIPLYPIYGRYLGPHVGKPYLHHTASLCKRLFISLSDRSNIEHWANAITLIVNGMSREQFDAYNKGKGGDKKMSLGAGGRLHVNGGPGNQTPLFFLEHRGQAIDSLRKSVEELKDDIRQSVSDAATKQASVLELATVRFFNEGQKWSRLRLVQMLLQESALNAVKRTCLYYKTSITADAMKFPQINTQHLIDLKEKREYVVRGREAKVSSLRSSNEQAVLTGLVETTLSPEEYAKRELDRHVEELKLIGPLESPQIGSPLTKTGTGSSEPVDADPESKPIEQGEDGTMI